MNFSDLLLYYFTCLSWCPVLNDSVTPLISWANLKNPLPNLQNTSIHDNFVQIWTIIFFNTDNIITVLIAQINSHWASHLRFLYPIIHNIFIKNSHYIYEQKTNLIVFITKEPFSSKCSLELSLFYRKSVFYVPFDF